MKIAVIGAGYVGLVSGTCFAEVGYHVTCVDINREKIALLRNGISPIFEPGLEEKVRRNLDRRLFFTFEYEEAIPEADIIFLALPTPSGEGGEANLQSIEEATRMVGRHMTQKACIVTKSTVPPGTCQKIRGWLREETELPFEIAANPEFLKQGDAVNDFMKPDRVVIGVENEETGHLLKELYSPFSVSHDRILIMDLASAEMTKYASNAMLATRISFMNELSRLCEQMGADITQVRLGVGSDRRIGYSFLYAGIGYGGSCFPKDILALESMGKMEGCPMPILGAVQETNERALQRFLERIWEYFDGDLANRCFGILGLSFKPETDDLRHAPSLMLIEQLLAAGATLNLYDPVAIPNAKKLLGKRVNVAWASDEIACATGTDALILVTEWKQFRQLDYEELGACMRTRVLFDGRNQYKLEEMQQRGFTYISTGRPVTTPSLVS